MYYQKDSRIEYGSVTVDWTGRLWRENESFVIVWLLSRWDDIWLNVTFIYCMLVRGFAVSKAFPLQSLKLHSSVACLLSLLTSDLVCKENTSKRAPAWFDQWWIQKRTKRYESFYITPLFYCEIWDSYSAVHEDTSIL